MKLQKELKPVYEGERIKLNTTEKIDCYLVWDVDITNKETSLRAITTTKELAEKYKKGMEIQHEEFSNRSKFFVEIEHRELNHAYGLTVLGLIGLELNKEKNFKNKSMTCTKCECDSLNNPRNQCFGFFMKNNIKNPKLVTKEVFDSYYEEKQFKEGPFKDTFGTEYGEPYNPRKQAFGILKDGSGVFCELGA